MKKEDALVRLELHLTTAQSFRLMDQIKNIKRYSDRIYQLLDDECTVKRQESIRACQKWMDIEERNIGAAVWGNIVLQPQKLDRAAAVAIWKAALCYDKPAGDLIDLLRSLQLKVIGHLRDPLGFFLREPIHQGLLQREKVDGVQASQLSGLGSRLLLESSHQDLCGSDGFRLLTLVLDTLDKAFSVQTLGKGKIERTRSDTGNDELHSVLTIEGRTVVISVL